MYDLDEYEVERGFYFNFLDHLAGPIIKTEEELIDAVINIGHISKEYKEMFEAFNDRYNALNDGHVCERFYELLKDGCFDEGRIDKCKWKI